MRAIYDGDSSPPFCQRLRGNCGIGIQGVQWWESRYADWWQDWLLATDYHKVVGLPGSGLQANRTPPTLCVPTMGT